MLQYFRQFPEETALKETTRNEFNQTIHPSCRIHKSHIGEYVDLYANTMMMESSIDDYSYMAGNCQVLYSTIGKFCSIANQVVINPGNHPQWRVTQHHMTYRRKSYGLDIEDDEEFFEWRKRNSCSVGHDVWMGHGAIILPGVKIGIGAIIGSAAVVTKDVPDYGIAVGVGAKVIKKRFTDDIIAKLLKSEWWNWDRATLEERYNDLFDMNLFLSKYC